MRETEVAGPTVRAIDLFFEMCPTVVLEDLGLEVFNAQAEPRNSHLTERFQLVLLQRPRFALKGDLRCPVPGHDFFQACHQPAELRGAQVGRRPAAEIDVVQGPAANDRFARQQLHFFN